MRFTFEDEHYRVDFGIFLIVYYVALYSFDLKIGRLKHQDIGQMQMYVNYYDRKVKLEMKIQQLEFCYAKIKMMQ